MMIDPATVALVCRVTGLGTPESEAIATKLGEWGRTEACEWASSGKPGLREEIMRRASAEQESKTEADDSTPAE